jgi:hypothetical protein
MDIDGQGLRIDQKGVTHEGDEPGTCTGREGEDQE